MNLNTAHTIIEQKPNSKGVMETINTYLKGKILGRGGFAECREVINEANHQLLAAKIIPKSMLSKQRNRQKMVSEIKIHGSFNHPNIVKFISSFEDRENVYIIMELCQYHSLNDLIAKRKSLSEVEARYFMYQLIQGIKHMHDRQIIHRDLKPHNILLASEMKLKICDLGLATKVGFEGERKRTICGTPNYLAPEIIDGKNGHSFEVDVWACGIILYTLLIGKPPFYNEDVKSIYKKIKANSYTYPLDIEISMDAKELIRSILNSDPLKRPSLDQILASPFFSSIIPASLPVSILKSKPTLAILKKLDLTSKHHALVDCYSAKQLLKYNIGDIKIDAINSTNSEVDIISFRYIESYGLGYMLSNEIVGAYFNDMSKIVMDKDECHVHYYQAKEDNGAEYNLNDYPKELTKKVKLIALFKKYLPGNTDKENIVPSHSVVYLKKWAKTDQAYIFMLSNKVLHVDFKDSSSIVFYKSYNVIAYTNKNKEKILLNKESAYALEDVELNKKLMHIKTVLSNAQSIPAVACI